MPEHRTDATVSGDGSVTVSGLPFRAGETVEVIIVSRSGAQERSDGPLLGSVRRYDAPFEPAANPSDWEAEA